MWVSDVLSNCVIGVRLWATLSCTVSVLYCVIGVRL